MTARSLRDWIALLRAEIVDLAARAIVATFDRGAVITPPGTPLPPISCAECAARARAAGHTVVPAQNGPTAAEQAIAEKVTAAAVAAVPPPPLLPSKAPRAGIVAATCPTCGPIEITDSRTVTGVFYQACPDLSWYGFTCPTCHARVTRQAVEAVRAALGKVATGILIDTAPAEVLEQHPTGTLTHDDVLDAILELDTHDDLAALAAAAHQPAEQPEQPGQPGQPREIDLRDGDR